MEFRNRKQRTARDTVLVRNGYYTFSKSYPAGKLGTVSRAARRRNRKKTAAHLASLVGLFCVVLCVAFLTTDVGLKLSGREPIVSTLAAQSGAEVLDEGVQALFLPSETLQSNKAMRKFIRKVRRKDCNAVIIDFKMQDGRLLYSSSEQLALLGKCSIYNNATVRDAIKQFTNAKIHVIARIYCFEDPLIASLDGSLAVKYLDSDVSWLDKHTEEGGQPWLNPFQQPVQDYLKAIVSEVQNFGVNGIVLSSVCFPRGENPETAGFPGEESSNRSRNTLLKAFVSEIKASLSDRCFLLVEEEADAILNGSEELYDGTLLPTDADGVLVDTRVRDAEVEINKKSNYSDFLNYLSSVKEKIGTEKKCILLLDADDATNKCLKALRRADFGDQIRFDDDGDY